MPFPVPFPTLEPHFVYALEHRDHVYFFFREVSVEDARLGRVRSWVLPGPKNSSWLQSPEQIPWTLTPPHILLHTHSLQLSPAIAGHRLTPHSVPFLCCDPCICLSALLTHATHHSQPPPCGSLPSLSSLRCSFPG